MWSFRKVPRWLVLFCRRFVYGTEWLYGLACHLHAEGVQRRRRLTHMAREDSSMEAPTPTPSREHDRGRDALPDSLRDMDRDDLSRLVRQINDDGRGVSYGKMAERAIDPKSGESVSKSYLQKLATNSVAKPPTAAQLGAIAAALGQHLSIVHHASAVQYMDYQATELSGYDEDTRVIVAHLAGMAKAERRRWRAMIEAADRSHREAD